jgi:glycosyltransferase involved in cell wall biosynthesis
MKISAVIPVYNAASTLRWCVDSVLERGWEVVLVDDCSTDGSSAICDEYLSRATVFHRKANGGASSARNLGMTMATGTHVAFVDADDYIDGPVFIYDPGDLGRRVDDYLAAPYKPSGLFSAWGKIYKLDMCVRFDPTMTLFEDIDFLFRYLKKNGSVQFHTGYKYTHPTATGNHAGMAITHNQQKMIKKALDSIKAYKPDADTDHAYVCLTIVHLVRSCRRLSFDAFRHVRRVLGDFDSRKMAAYRRAKGHSIVIPLFLKLGMAIPTTIACHLKARKRYA